MSTSPETTPIASGRSSILIHQKKERWTALCPTFPPSDLGSPSALSPRSARRLAGAFSTFVIFSTVTLARAATKLAQTEPGWDILLYCRGSTSHFGTTWHKSATRATHTAVHRVHRDHSHRSGTRASKGNPRAEEAVQSSWFRDRDSYLSSWLRHTCSKCIKSRCQTQFQSPVLIFGQYSKSSGGLGRAREGSGGLGGLGRARGSEGSGERAQKARES